MLNLDVKSMIRTLMWGRNAFFGKELFDIISINGNIRSLKSKIPSINFLSKYKSQYALLWVNPTLI